MYMRLSEKQINHMAFVIVRKIIKKNLISTEDKNILTDRVANIIEHDLKKEDELNEQVKDLLMQHSSKMRKENIDYGEMFKMIKNKLAKEKGIVL